MGVFILNDRNMNIGNSTGSLEIVRNILFASAYNRPRPENAIYLLEKVVIVLLGDIQQGLNIRVSVCGVYSVLFEKLYSKSFVGIPII